MDLEDFSSEENILSSAPSSPTTDSAAAAEAKFDSVVRSVLPRHPSELTITNSAHWIDLFCRHPPETQSRLVENRIPTMWKFMDRKHTRAFEAHVREFQLRALNKGDSDMDNDAESADYLGPDTFCARAKVLVDAFEGLPRMVPVNASGSGGGTSETPSYRGAADFKPPARISSANSRNRSNSSSNQQSKQQQQSMSEDNPPVGSKRRKNPSARDMVSPNMQLVPARKTFNTVYHTCRGKLGKSMRAYMNAYDNPEQPADTVLDDALAFVVVRKAILYTPFNPPHTNDGQFAKVMFNIISHASIQEGAQVAPTTPCVACFDDTPFRTGTDQDARSQTSNIVTLILSRPVTVDADGKIVPDPKRADTPVTYLTACKEHSDTLRTWHQLAYLDQMGARGYFPKINEETVASAIKKIMQQMRGIAVNAISWNIPVLLAPFTPTVVLSKSDAPSLHQLIHSADWWVKMTTNAPVSRSLESRGTHVSMQDEEEPEDGEEDEDFVVDNHDNNNQDEDQDEEELPLAPVLAPPPVRVSAPVRVAPAVKTLAPVQRAPPQQAGPSVMRTNGHTNGSSSSHNGDDSSNIMDIPLPPPVRSKPAVSLAKFAYRPAKRPTQLPFVDYENDDGADLDSEMSGTI